jgi:hypothetical protein
MRGRNCVCSRFSTIRFSSSSCGSSALLHYKKTAPTQQQRNYHPNDDEQLLFAFWRWFCLFSLFGFGSHSLSFVKLDCSHY